MKVSIIAAIGTNNEIGLNNKLLWSSKSDLEHFKQLTLGKPIIMGRKTFESLPGILPGRPNLVVSTSDIATRGAMQFGALRFALEYSRLHLKYEEVFIIGGASIFEQALPLADELHISHMDWTGEADTFFPEIGPEWERNNTAVTTLGVNSPAWTYVRYVRTK